MAAGVRRHEKVVAVPGIETRGVCPNCRAVDARKTGYCRECGTPVCDRCGNTQITINGTYVIHDACLAHAAPVFSMIKIVK